jgi:hypothetical protein
MPETDTPPTPEASEEKISIAASIQTNHIFKYQKNGVTLEFTLSPKNIQDFKDILTQALQDLTNRF